MSQEEMNAIAHEWLRARDIIAQALRKWTADDHLVRSMQHNSEEFAAAIIARLAQAEPPILTTTLPEMEEAERLKAEVERLKPFEAAMRSMAEQFLCPRTTAEELARDILKGDKHDSQAVQTRSQGPRPDPR